MTIIASACWGTEQYRKQILWDRRVGTVVGRCRINGKCELSGFQVRNFEIPHPEHRTVTEIFVILHRFIYQYSLPLRSPVRFQSRNPLPSLSTSHLIDLNLLYELV